MKQTLFWTALIAAAAIAAGGYWQVLTLQTFWCGRIGAFPTIHVLTAAALLQFGLFVSAVASPKYLAAYRRSQLAILPFLVLGLIELFWWHAASAVFFAAAGGLPLLVARRAGWLWVRDMPLAAFGIGALTLLGTMTALVQIPLSMAGAIVTDPVLVGAVGLGLVLGVAALGQLERWFGPGAGRHAVPPMLPLSLLLLAVLRAKYPDVSYDAFLYKATLPMQMADWRSGDMPIMDALMVGTTFQEMMNAGLIMVTGDYLPTLISTVSFGLLFCIAPLAFALPPDARRPEQILAAFAMGMAFTLTEAGIAQGTSYQEPLLLLLLTASLLPGPIWPAFLAMAVMVKINAAFIAPLILLLQFQRAALPLRTGVVIVCSVLLVVAPQIGRNLTYSGRLLGQSEILAARTDPPGPNQIMVGGASHFDGQIRGGPVNNGLASACNMFLLSAVCPTSYHGEDISGFHAFPASRAPLLAIVACALLLVLAATRGARVGIALASVGLYALAYVLLLSFMSEARYFLPLSFGFAVLLLINRVAFANLLLDGAALSAHSRALIVVSVVVLGTDLVPGIYTNVSWICRRGPFAPAQSQPVTEPRTPTEKFLAMLTSDYRRHCPPPGLPPVILGQHDKLNAPYLGAQVSHFYLTHEMNDRFYAADPSRRAGLPKAVLALAYVDPAVPSRLLGPAVDGFTECFANGDYHVLCSKQLAPEGNECAQSLFPGRTAAAKP